MRALDVTVDSSLLWVGVGLALAAAVLLAFVPRLPSADAVQRVRPLERQRAADDRHEPPSSGVCGHADRRVVRAARRRRDAADDAVALQAAQTGLQPAQRARDERAGHVVSAARPIRSRRSTRKPCGGSPSCPAWNGSRSARIVPWREAGAFGPGFQFSVEGYVEGRTAKRIRARASARSRPDSSRRVGVPLIAGRDFNEADRTRRREGRHRQPERRAADVSDNRMRSIAT